MKAKKQSERKTLRTPREFEHLAAGMWQRDKTPKEEAKILQAKRDARAEIIARKEAVANHTFAAGSGMEIRTNKNCSLDEIVGRNVQVHLEQLTNQHWWIGIYDSEGRTIHINLSTSKESIRGLACFEGIPGDKPKDFSTRSTRTRKIKTP